MALYPKNLRSIEELRQERLRMKQESDGMFSNFLGPVPAKKGSDAHDEEDVIGADNFVETAMDFITSKGFAGKASALAVPLLSLAGRKIQGTMLQKAAKEILGGYIKWKGVEVGAKIAMSFIKKSKDKKRR